MPLGLQLSKNIERWYNGDEFAMVVVYGRSGLGKTSYAWQSLFEIYPQKKTQTRAEYIDSLKQYLVFTPRELINLGDRLEAENLRIPAIIVDDAGLHFGKMDYRDPVVVAALKYLQVIRSQVACIIFTTPSPTALVSALRSLDMHIVKITKYDPGYRLAVGYNNAVGPRGKVWTNRVWEDTFLTRLPDDFWAWYKPLRESYAKFARQKLREEVDHADRKAAKRNEQGGE